MVLIHTTKSLNLTLYLCSCKANTGNHYGLYMEMGFLSAVIAEIVRPKLHLWKHSWVFSTIFGVMKYSSRNFCSIQCIHDNLILFEAFVADGNFLSIFVHYPCKKNNVKNQNILYLTYCYIKDVGFLLGR